MTLRRIIVNNSVRYIQKKEQTREKKPIMMKNKKQSEQFQTIPGGGKKTRENKTILFRKTIKNSLKM